VCFFHYIERIMPLFLIKRMITLPFIYPLKVSMIYSNIQLSFVEDIPITCNTKALKSYEIILARRIKEKEQILLDSEVG
jgi:hypothetical protein